MKYYKIKTILKGKELFFLSDYGLFSGKYFTTYKGRKAACDGLEYAKKCASSQEMLDNLEIVEV